MDNLLRKLPHNDVHTISLPSTKNDGLLCVYIPCRMVRLFRRFGGTCCLHLRDDWIFSGTCWVDWEGEIVLYWNSPKILANQSCGKGSGDNTVARQWELRARTVFIWYYVWLFLFHNDGVTVTCCFSQSVLVLVDTYVACWSKYPHRILQYILRLFFSMESGVHCRVYKSPPLIPFPIRMSPVHTTHCVPWKLILVLCFYMRLLRQIGLLSLESILKNIRHFLHLQCMLRVPLMFLLIL
jgi:hypothetical protein